MKRKCSPGKSRSSALLRGGKASPVIASPGTNQASFSGKYNGTNDWSLTIRKWSVARPNQTVPIQPTSRPELRAQGRDGGTEEKAAAAMLRSEPANIYYHLTSCQSANRVTFRWYTTTWIHLPFAAKPRENSTTHQIDGKTLFVTHSNSTSAITQRFLLTVDDVSLVDGGDKYIFFLHHKGLK